MHVMKALNFFMESGSNEQTYRLTPAISEALCVVTCALWAFADEEGDGGGVQLTLRAYWSERDDV